MKTMSRRTLLRGAGGVGVALPFLDAMAPRLARAQDSTTSSMAPRRLFLMLNQNGVVPGTWFPTGGEKDFKLASSMASLEPLREHLIILDGIKKMERGTQDGTAHKRGHNSAVTGWTSSSDSGAADGASIDQVVANAIGGKSRVKSLMTGRVTNYHFLHDGPRQVHPVEPDPKKNFDRLFTGFAPPAAGGAPDPGAVADLARLRARKKSILDATIEQYQKLAQKVGPTDRQKLEKHMAAIRQVEVEIDNAASAPTRAAQGCARPPDPATSADYQVIGKTALDLCALAFACDLTRVAGLQWISHGNVFNWLGVTEKHHPLAHQTGGAGPDAQLTKIVAWHAEQAAAFLTKLKGFTDPAGGTVLDNTLFLWTNEVSVGSHKFDRGPFLIASGKFPLATGGTLQTGRYLKYGGNPHTSVLQSITLAMGAGKMPVYGEWDKGPLPNLIS
jgi:hypothetical protein